MHYLRQRSKWTAQYSMQIAGLPDNLSVRFTFPNLYPAEPIEWQRTIKSSRTLLRINRFLLPSIRLTVTRFHLVPEVVVVVVVVAFSPALVPRQINAPIILLLPTYVDNNLHHAKTTRPSRAPRALVISIICDKEKKNDTPAERLSREAVRIAEKSRADRSEMRI